jgi:hypothetical protein
MKRELESLVTVAGPRAAHAIRLMVLSALLAACGADAHGSPTPLPEMSAEPTTSASPVQPSQGGPASPSALETPAPGQSSPPPTPEILGPHWEHIGQVAADRWVSQLLGFDSGYVAFSQMYTVGMSDAWFSSDGVGWAKVDLGAGPGCRNPDDTSDVRLDGIEAGTSTKVSVLLVGSEVYADPDTSFCTKRAVAWLSHDGRSWQRSAPFGEPGESEAQAAWPIAGGWEAAVAQYEWRDETAMDTVRTTVWRTADGAEWEQVSDSALAPAEVIGSAPPAAAGADLNSGTRVMSSFWWVSVGESWSPLVYDSHVRMSDNGSSWADLEAPFAQSQPERFVTHILPPTIDSGEWLFVDNDEYLRGATGWATSDFVAWRAFELPRQNLDAIEMTDSGLLVSGCNRQDERCGQYLSTDGQSWVEIEPRLQGAIDLASGPAGVLLVGVESGRVWRLMP